MDMPVKPSWTELGFGSGIAVPFSEASPSSFVGGGCFSLGSFGQGAAAERPQAYAVAAADADRKAGLQQVKFDKLEPFFHLQVGLKIDAKGSRDLH